MFWIIIALIGVIANGGSAAINAGSLYPPFSLGLARRGYKEHPDLIPQLADLISQRYKDVIDDDTFFALMAQAGYNKTVASNIYEGTRKLLNGVDYITLFRREEISEEDMYKRLDSIGYNEQTIEDLKKVSLYYPNPDDLVRFAVREVFTPATAEKYGLYEDLPEEFIKASGKAGLSESFAKQYWAAHWELPSARQGAEMFQRDIIEEEDFLLLLKSLDYMPYWRDKLKQLQYNVITRVDVRRLYKTGVYTEEQVFKAYENMGYSPKDAKDLTDFTLAQYAPIDEEEQSKVGLTRNKEGELVPTRATTIQAYQKGVYDRDEALLSLIDLGYDNNNAELLLKLVDEDLKQEIIDIKADTLADDYQRGDINEIQFRYGLTALGVSSRYIEIIIARELAQAKRRSKTPTRADLDKWLKIGLIDPEEFIRRMKAMGYSDTDANLYLQENIIDMEGKE